MQQSSDQGEIIIESLGSAGVIRLNRAKAINSLNEAMVRDIEAGLGAFAQNHEITSVILCGEGERGLCAGGDVRQIYAARAASEADRTRFWREEFPLNYAIAHYPKPFIAFMDGIVMGGGVGVSAHGRYRIVTERTRLAMPETAIGYFPDVGATWLLPKAPGEAGTWLGLTGREVGAADAIYLGLGDYHIPSARLLELMEALGRVSFSADIGAVIESFATPAEGTGQLAGNRDLIDAAFAGESVEAIIAALSALDNDFARETLATLQSRSPTSLKLTLRLLRMGGQSSGLVECLEREFVAGCEVLRNHDFYEGVRAALIDKDRDPKWRPDTLQAVSSEALDRYFVSSLTPLFPDHRL